MIRFVNWLKANGFSIEAEGGEGIFKYYRLVNGELMIYVAMDAKIKNRAITYFYLYDNRIGRIRIDGEKRITLMWEVPVDEKYYQDAIEGKLIPVV